jgi:hypothetical protein
MAWIFVSITCLLERRCCLHFGSLRIYRKMPIMSSNSNDFCKISALIFETICNIIVLLLSSTTLRYNSEFYFEFILRPTDSRTVNLGIGPPFGTLDQILSWSSFLSDNYFILLSKASSLTIKRVCSWQCNHSLVPITILYRLIWDCVPLLSPLTMRSDYGGGILTRLHTGDITAHCTSPYLYCDTYNS